MIRNSAARYNYTARRVKLCIAAQGTKCRRVRPRKYDYRVEISIKGTQMTRIGKIKWILPTAKLYYPKKPN